MKARDARAWAIILTFALLTAHQAHLLHVSATAVGAITTTALALAWGRRRHIEESHA